MAKAQVAALRHLRKVIERRLAVNLTEGELLRRFAGERDETAFAGLVQRHGGMVLGVCQHVLRHEQEAEDAFQATFLVLARKAGAICKHRSIAGWLHGVAYRTALNARKMAMRRRKHERHSEPQLTESAASAAAFREIQALVDQEVQALPQKYRTPFVLCCLEGKSRAEAARQLGCKEGTIFSRLGRGRELLRRRLSRRGVVLPTALAALAVSQNPVKAALAGATVRAAGLFVSGQGAAVSASVSSLAKTVLTGMVVSQLKTVTACVLAFSLVVIGASIAAERALSVNPAEASSQTKQHTAGEATQRPSAAPQEPRSDGNAEFLPEGAVRRLGSSHLRIGNSDFALTPDGQTIATVSGEGIVRKFDANTGRLLERRQLTDRSDVDPSGQSIAFLSIDGKTAAIPENTRQGRITVYDLASGKIVFRRESTKDVAIGNYALAPDGKQLAMVENSGENGWTRTLVVHDLKTGRRTKLGNVELNVYGIRFSMDGKRVVLSQTGWNTKAAKHERDDTFACFDVPSGKQLWRMPWPGGTFAFSPDGNTVVSATFDQRRFQVIEIDPRSGKAVEAFKPTLHAHPNCTIMIAPDNRTVVTNHFGSLSMWDLRKGEPMSEFPVPKRRWPRLWSGTRRVLCRRANHGHQPGRAAALGPGDGQAALRRACRSILHGTHRAPCLHREW